MKQIRKRLTYANVMSSLAVFLVLGGGAAVAANQVAKNTVGTPQLKKNAVKAPKIARNAVKAPKIAPNAVTRGKIAAEAVDASRLAPNAVNAAKLGDGSVTGAKLADGAITGAKVANGSLSSAKLGDVHIIPMTRMAATGAANFEAARAAAPMYPLVSNGTLSLYAKCLTDETQMRTQVDVLAATTQPGTLMTSWADWLEGEPFLNPGTTEPDRQSLSTWASANDVSATESMVQIVAPGGAVLSGQLYGFAKNGNPTDGDGAYGAGNACIVAGNVFS